MITHSYIEVSGGGYSREKLGDSLLKSIFNELNKVVPFNRKHENTSEYTGSYATFSEEYELIDGKSLVFKVVMPPSFCISINNNNFRVSQCVYDNGVLLSENYFLELRASYTTHTNTSDNSTYWSMTPCTLLYTTIANENYNLFYMKNVNGSTYYGFAGTYKIDDKVFCVTKSSLNEAPVIWDEENNKYYIANILVEGFTTDKENSFITMSVFLASNASYDSGNPTIIYTDYVFKDWLLADSYHCVPNSTYTINGIDYFCHNVMDIGLMKHSLLIKI